VTGSSAALTATHPEFPVLSNLKVSSCDLGWRLQTPSGRVGLALKPEKHSLDKPVTFRLRLSMIPNPSKDAGRPPPGNGFLAFGDGPDDTRLVKCGFRSAGQCLQVVEGPLLKGSVTPAKAKVDVSKPLDMTVVYDPQDGRVTMTALGQTATTTLTRKLKTITHVGYAVHSVAADFGRITIHTE